MKYNNSFIIASRAYFQHFQPVSSWSLQLEGKVFDGVEVIPTSHVNMQDKMYYLSPFKLGHCGIPSILHFGGRGPRCWKYALEAIIKVLLYFNVHDNCLVFML